MHPLWIPIILVAAMALLGLVGWGCRRLLDNPRGDVEGGLVWLGVRLYARFVHRLTVAGRENVPRDRRPGPLIVVSNHGAGVDPVLIQAVCPFQIRFMMAKDMQIPALAALWRWAGVIPVDRSGPDSGAAREAIRCLKAGGVVGVFPEGRLVHEPGALGEFLPGVGLMIRRTGAAVLPVVIRGTPRTPTPWGSLFRRSRARLTFLPPVDYSARGMTAQQIAEDVRSRMASAA